jgi:hypothetical protein
MRSEVRGQIAEVKNGKSKVRSQIEEEKAQAANGQTSGRQVRFGTSWFYFLNLTSYL